MRRTNCRTGRASMNSLARRISGPSGKLVEARVPAKRHGACCSVCRCASAMTGLVSTNATETVSRKLGAARQARRASASSVPRPGPKLGDGRWARLAHALPHRDRPKADQLAEDLADLRRRDEIALRRRSAGGTCRRLPRCIEQAGLHEVFDTEGTMRWQRAPAAAPRAKRASVPAWRSAAHEAIAGFARARQINHSPIRIIGME